MARILTPTVLIVRFYSIWSVPCLLSEIRKCRLRISDGNSPDHYRIEKKNQEVRNLMQLFKIMFPKKTQVNLCGTSRYRFKKILHL